MKGVIFRKWFAVFDGEEQLTAWSRSRTDAWLKGRNILRNNRPKAKLTLRAQRFIEPERAAA